ncbi:nucleopolyhedrovirus P10 family protein [Streptomyces sp. CRN 30]|uniref:nucleopolyhedrovirus P10 family protein n=1 Tax=Streptomyces sp. CRN 30 TaxID=3075613 RepID=UPI002A7F3481|nr:nucleopolyhedrovirus P10 family protein [Streptomyces sp. CRN 30]
MTEDGRAGDRRRAALSDTTAGADLRAVRRRLGLGRVLPLGGPRDGAWITEQAAGPVLRSTAASVRGARLGRLRLSPSRPEQSHDPAVPPPPSALPPGPLRIDAEVRVAADPLATAAEPLPVTAARLRAALARTAAERLGLTVTEVDLRVTGLLDSADMDDTGDTEEVKGAEDTEGVEGAEDTEPAGPDPGPGPAGAGEEARVAAAVLAVPGVTRLTGVLGRPDRAIRIGTGPALPRRHVRVEIAVASERRALDVARAVRTAAGGALPDHPSVAVLVTAVDRANH